MAIFSVAVITVFSVLNKMRNFFENHKILIFSLVDRSHLKKKCALSFQSIKLMQGSLPYQYTG